MTAAGVRRRVAATLGVLLAGTIGQLAVRPEPAGADSLPAGRSTYVVSMMSGPPEALTVRLAIYMFTASGRVTERYWAWRQNEIAGKGNVRWTKPASGYVTNGCLHACPVRTPVGFQKGLAGQTAVGHWWTSSNDVLAIRWASSQPVESWQLDEDQPGFAGADLVSAGSSAAVGWGIGSNASATRGIGLAQIYRTSSWITGPFAENAYQAQTEHTSVGWNPSDYTLCSTGRCLQSRTETSSDLKSWYSSYFAANAAVDGRKVYWNNQTGVVQQLENPGSVCISASGGGHTNALLEGLDDDGGFVGFVGVEASLNQRKYGQDVVAAYAMVPPSELSSIGQ